MYYTVTEGRGLYECIGKRNVLKIKQGKKIVCSVKMEDYLKERY
jgi:hypothetical protein